MAFEGSWSKGYVQDPERFSRHKPPHTGTPTDAPVGDPASQPSSAGLVVAAGEISSDAIFENTHILPKASVIDQTPIYAGVMRRTGAETGRGVGGVARTGSPTTHPPYLSEHTELTRPLGDARGRDYGAGEFGSHRFQSYGAHGQRYDEHRSTTVSEGLPTTPMANQGGDGYLQYRRGDNADPANDGSATAPGANGERPGSTEMGPIGRIRGSNRVNTPVWKTARYQRSHIQRRFMVTRQQPTDQVRFNAARIPTMAENVPATRKPTKWASPFDSLAKTIPKAKKLSGINRTAGPWYEPALAAHEDTPPSAYRNYDGMVVQ